MIKAPKKLIEVALPLDDINIASAKEKSIRHGHPSTLHIWWARRPLAAARAVLFAQLVNDPGGERGWGNYPGQTKEDAQTERERLFGIIRKLVIWKNSNNEDILKEARQEIWKSWRETCLLNEGKDGFDPDKLPSFHDPFAGGGAIPLEAQRLGLQTYASDLNPVAVVINKAMIEIPKKFSNQKPVSLLNIDNRKEKKLPGFEDKWPDLTGMAEDVRYYGQWIRNQAHKKIGHLFPDIAITKDHAKVQEELKGHIGEKLTIIAWIWARTIKCSNPACGCEVPLAKSFELSTKKREKVWLEPVIDTSEHHFKIKFNVKTGMPTVDEQKRAKAGSGYINKLGKRVQATFQCIACGIPIKASHIDEIANEKALGSRLMTIVAAGFRKRIYLNSSFINGTKLASEIDKAYSNISRSSYLPTQKCKGTFASNAQGRRYGFHTFKDYFSKRQLISLATFAELIFEVKKKIIADANAAGWIDDGVGLNNGGTNATAYSDAIIVYLSLVLDKVTDYWSTICSWHNSGEKIGHTFGRQAIPMTWDFVEANPFSNSSGNWIAMLNWVYKNILNFKPMIEGYVSQADAASQNITSGKIVSTDPPYYDNVTYSDLSDFFYVWMRVILKSIYPDLFATLVTPKEDELIANPYRQGGKNEAEGFFLNGMTSVMKRLANQSNSSFPLTIYYAFKQDSGKASAGWETFLDAVLKAGFAITGTWPMRSEMSSRRVAVGTNALASSIILVCRKRTDENLTTSRRQFQRELKTALPEALDAMIGGRKGASPIAPVDLAQAAIGPGMAVFSKYAKVLEADGTPMRVHDALVQINREIDDYFNAAEGDLDPDSRFCIDWFQQYGFKAGNFGDADVVARAKGTSVDAVAVSGVIKSGAGNVKLLTFSDYPKEWNPDKDPNIPIWEATHQLIRTLRVGGEKESSFLLSRLPGKTEQIRQLAYRLYTLCERKGWAEEARAYNELISSWHRIVSASEDVGIKRAQMSLFRT